MKYLRKFENHSAYQAEESNLVLPNVSLCVQENEVHYNPYVNYANDYLTFVAKENGTFTFTPKNNNTISYSTDGGSTWTEGNSVEVNNGDKVMWKGAMTSNIGSFSASTNSFDVQGNVMSLLYGDNFKNQTDLSGKDYAFYGLFQKTKVVNAENLSLLATTLAQSCYTSMFSGCKSLTSTPELPATTLARSCYENMFYGCTSLTSTPSVLPATKLAQSCYAAMFSGCTSLTVAPELPATTLATSCYQHMFYGCTSLTVAPELPAKTLKDFCYGNMFYGCTNLSSITCLATNKSASSCTYYWVYGVASNGTFTKAASMSSWTSGIDGIPTNWTVQDYSE